MRDHPVIVNAQREFDLLEGRMSYLYGLGKECGVDPVFLDNYGNMVNQWTDSYMKCFADVRTTDDLKVFDDARGKLVTLVEEGLAFHEDFRILCQQTNEAERQRLIAKRNQIDEDFKREHPILARIEFFVENFFRKFQKK